MLALKIKTLWFIVCFLFVFVFLGTVYWFLDTESSAAVKFKNIVEAFGSSSVIINMFLWYNWSRKESERKIFGKPLQLSSFEIRDVVFAGSIGINEIKKEVILKFYNPTHQMITINYFKLYKEDPYEFEGISFFHKVLREPKDSERVCIFGKEKFKKYNVNAYSIKKKYIDFRCVKKKNNSYYINNIFQIMAKESLVLSLLINIKLSKKKNDTGLRKVCPINLILGHTSSNYPLENLECIFHIGNFLIIDEGETFEDIYLG
ncbi:hypothetical protein [Bartonella sp. B30(2025)]